MSLVFKCYLKKQPTPPFPSKEIAMNSIFISSKSHPNLRVTTFLLILINSKGLMVNTGFFFVRLIHRFSESISVKAGSNLPCYIKFRPKLSFFLGQQQEFTN